MSTFMALTKGRRKLGTIIEDLLCKLSVKLASAAVNFFQYTTVKLVGTDYDKIIHNVSELLTDTEAHTKMSYANNPYGDGKACQRIVEVLTNIKPR